MRLCVSVRKFSAVLHVSAELQCRRNGIHNGAFLQAFTFRSRRRHDPLLAAVATLKMLSVEGRRVLPDRVPVGHLGATERKRIFDDGKPDRRLYEIATLAHLPDRLHSRDVWVEGSRSFRPIDEDLMPKPTFVALKGQDQLGLGVPERRCSLARRCQGDDGRQSQKAGLARPFRQARWCEDGKRHVDRDAASQRCFRRGGSPQCRNHGHVSSGRGARSSTGRA